MIPVQAIAIPMFVHIKNFNLINTSPGIIITYVVIELAFAIFIMTGFISRSVPDSIIEAASIDGCNVFGVFVRMVLPLAKFGYRHGRNLRVSPRMERIFLRFNSAGKTGAYQPKSDHL